jgi:DNA mismatch repair protein MutS2
MERMLNRKDLQDCLQDKYVTVREGRFVLPGKSSFRHEVRGTIHGTSQSGQTVFVEPQEFIDANNRLREIDVDIEIEEYRILSELASHAAHEVEALRRNIDILLTADVWIAAARMADRLDANRFDFSEEDVHFVHARHPLLVRSGVDVVPNTITLSRGQIMIVTGPNAGGKTVLIKTVGLLALMARMGLPLPVGTGSRCPFFGNVHTLIGDDQSLTSHVSTFSAQILHLKEILARAQRGHLMLLDELATGTDPQQGAFLAQAVLEHIAEAGIAAIGTTHFTALKTLPLLDSRFFNVSVGGNALRPDYRLVPGQPGTSEGIAVAGQLGLAESIVRRARQLASQGDTRVDSLLSEITAIRTRMQEEEARLRERESELTQQLEDARKLKARMQKQLAQLRKDAMDDSLRELSRCRMVLSRLREKAEKGTIGEKELSAGLEKAARAIEAEERRTAGPAPDFEKLSPGDRVRSRKLRHEVEIVSIDHKKQKIQGRAGNLISTLDFDDLEMISKPESSSKKASRKDFSSMKESLKESVNESAQERDSIGMHDESLDSMSTTQDEPYLAPSNTLDLRGKRVEAALAELERHLDRMFRENQPGFHVIHGYGSGILCAAVRDHLSRSTYVSDFRPGRPDEGGDGVTAVFLA